ncbi:MAG: nucleotidyltransferase domain-containing protein [Candidatus Obscuribacterales bacterium]|nr:nucleotidyltransferase domain-containing protein [Candidatus Obscuribacterales bacterium]
MDNNGLDSEGYISNGCSLANISESFSAMLEDVRLAVVDAFKLKLHSIYLYGSVACGTARLVASDLDLFVAFQNELSFEDRALIKQLERDLSSRFETLVREVGLAAGSLAEILDGDNQVGWNCFIKHQCVCLFGDDLAAGMSKLRPTNAVAYGLNGDLSHELEKTKQLLAESSHASAGKTIMPLARKMVRTAFGLVMEAENKWTTDLDQCAHIFALHYPQHAKPIRHTLLLAKGEMVDSELCQDFVVSFAQWLCEEVDLKLKP